MAKILSLVAFSRNTLLTEHRIAIAIALWVIFAGIGLILANAWAMEAVAM
jgi:hypothetical protein